MIAPDGEIVFAHKGPIEILDVRHAALANFTDNLMFPGQSEYWARPRIEVVARLGWAMFSGFIIIARLNNSETR